MLLCFIIASCCRIDFPYIAEAAWFLRYHSYAARKHELRRNPRSDSCCFFFLLSFFLLFFKYQSWVSTTHRSYSQLTFFVFFRIMYWWRFRVCQYTIREFGGMLHGESSISSILVQKACSEGCSEDMVHKPSRTEATMIPGVIYIKN